MVIPVFFQYFQAFAAYPPLHPNPHEEQHEIKFKAEILLWSAWFDAIQILSLIASTAAKAQALPQFASSLTSWIDPHFG